MQGTFTIEVWSGWVGQEVGQNLCAETFDGTNFTGAIPMSGSGIVLEDEYPTKTTQVGLYKPHKMIIMNDDGSIYMFNAKNCVWKKINVN